MNRLYTDTLVKAERLERMAETIADPQKSLADQKLAAAERDKLGAIPKFASADPETVPELIKAEGKLGRLEQLGTDATDRDLARGHR